MPLNFINLLFSNSRRDTTHKFQAIANKRGLFILANISTKTINKLENTETQDRMEDSDIEEQSVSEHSVSENTVLETLPTSIISHL